MGQNERELHSDGLRAAPGAGRRPYVAPFLRHLDVSDTQGKESTTTTEASPDDGPS
jgi:hypothetical protein